MFWLEDKRFYFLINGMSWIGLSGHLLTLLLWNDDDLDFFGWPLSRHLIWNMYENPVPTRFDMKMIWLSKVSKDYIVRGWSLVLGPLPIDIWYKLYIVDSLERGHGVGEGLTQPMLCLFLRTSFCGVSTTLLWVRRGSKLGLVTRYGLVGCPRIS